MIDSLTIQGDDSDLDQEEDWTWYIQHYYLGGC